MKSHLEKESVFRTKRAKRWRKVLFQRSGALWADDWSVRWLCHRADAALGAARFGSCPRSRCRTSPAGKLRGYAARAAGRWLRYGHPAHKPQFVGCVGILPKGHPPATPSVCSCAMLQRTTTHHTPAPRPLVLEPGSAPAAADGPLFLSQAETVLRDTPKMRMRPRSEQRS